MKPIFFHKGQQNVSQPLNELSREISRHGMAIDDTQPGLETSIASFEETNDEDTLNQGFPYGDIFTMGILINGDTVTVYNAKLYEGPGAGHEITNGDADKNVKLTISTNPTYIAAKFVFSTKTLTIENMGSTEPYPGVEGIDVYHRPLYKFRYSNGNVYLERCLLFDIHLPGTWGQA